MSREEMIRLAHHCNLGLLVGPLCTLLDDEWERLHRFAALVAAAEREACAKYLDDCGEHEHANYIRSRGEVKP